MEGTVLEISNNENNAIITVGFFDKNTIKIEQFFYKKNNNLELLDIIGVTDAGIKKIASFSKLSKQEIENRKILNIIYSQQLMLVKEGKFINSDEVRTINWEILMIKYYEQMTKIR